MTEDPITVTDVDDGLTDTLSKRIDEFNTEATGFDDGRSLGVARRGSDGTLEAGLTGWTWGGSCYVEYARTEDSPHGRADVHLVKKLLPGR